MISLAFLLVTAAAGVPIHVTPADPTAMFKGDGSALKFDPTCRDYNIETVKADPACAARVAKGEAAPSLAIAAATLQSLPAKGDEAIKLLEHSASVTDSPAVHYFLGTVLHCRAKPTELSVGSPAPQHCSPARKSRRS